MRLYLSATSKNKIGYTPDTLIVELKNKHFEYDIQGETDYDIDGLATRTKGVLLLKNEKTDEYEEMTEQDEQDLIAMLNNPNSDIAIAIYPCMIENNIDKIESDQLTDCYGKLEIKDNECDFKFHTEFYGI